MFFCFVANPICGERAFRKLHHLIWALVFCVHIFPRFLSAKFQNRFHSIFKFRESFINLSLTTSSTLQLVQKEPSSFAGTAAKEFQVRGTSRRCPRDQTCAKIRAWILQVNNVPRATLVSLVDLFSFESNFPIPFVLLRAKLEHVPSDLKTCSRI